MEINCISEYEKIIKKNNGPNFFFDDSTDKFKITKQCEGKYPAIITISGFNSENKANNDAWKDGIHKGFPDHAWFHLEWNSQKLPKIMQYFIDKDESFVFKKSQLEGGLLKLASLASIFNLTITRLAINNWWHLAVRNSKHTGQILGDVLSACNKKQFILVGHSLGARVIFNCLEHMSSNTQQTNIAEVHLLGGAVNSRDEKWTPVNRSVKNKIYNYYSNNDKILRRLYYVAMIDKFAIGLSEIKITNSVNIDTAKDIGGHTEYIPKFHIIKAKNQSQN